MWLDYNNKREYKHYQPWSHKNSNIKLGEREGNKRKRTLTFSYFSVKEILFNITTSKSCVFKVINIANRTKNKNRLTKVGRVVNICESNL